MKNAASMIPAGLNSPSNPTTRPSHATPPENIPVKKDLYTPRISTAPAIPATAPEMRAVETIVFLTDIPVFEELGVPAVDSRLVTEGGAADHDEVQNDDRKPDDKSQIPRVVGQEMQQAGS